jgi:hypothetical protein
MAVRTHFDGPWRAAFSDGSWVQWSLPKLLHPFDPIPSYKSSLVIPPPSLSLCSYFRGILSGQRCACWEGDVIFSSSFGLSCTMCFHAGEGDVKKAMRSVGRLLRVWGSRGDAPDPPDLFEAEIVNADGKVLRCVGVLGIAL